MLHSSKPKLCNWAHIALIPLPLGIAIDVCVCARVCVCLSIHQSINQNLYSTPSRSLLRGVPDPGQEEKNRLENVVELRTGTVWEMP